MSLYKYQLKLPSQSTKERIVEVQFYFFMKTFIYKYGTDNRYIYDLINILSEIFETRPTAIRLAMESIKSPGIKPTYLESCIAAFWLGIPVRKLGKLIEMSPRTYYYKLDEYIEKGQYDLEPRLDPAVRKDLFKFIQNARIMFIGSNEALKGVDFYETN